MPLVRQPTPPSTHLRATSTIAITKTTTTKTHVEEEPVEALRPRRGVRREKLAAAFGKVQQNVPGLEQVKRLLCEFKRVSWRSPRADGAWEQTYRRGARSDHNKNPVSRRQKTPNNSQRQ